MEPDSRPWDPLRDPSSEIEIPIQENNEGPSKEGLRDIFKNRNRYQWSEKLGFIGGPSPKRKGRRLIAFSWASSLIDAALIFAFGALLISVSSILLKQLNSDILVGLTKIPGDVFWGSFFVLMSWVYQVSLRVFLGHTLGEWTYDIRLGTPTDRLLLNYGFKVILRSTLVIGTGFIFFPILSFVFGQDVLGRVCHLKIFSLR